MPKTKNDTSSDWIDPDDAPEWPDDVIQRARDAGLAGMMVLGVDVATSQQAVDLAREGIAEGAMLRFVAAGAEPEHEPAAAQLV